MGRYTTLVLAVSMLVVGSINTIAYKVADWQYAKGSYTPAQCQWPSAPPLPGNASMPSPPALPPSPPPEPGCKFQHPFVQVYAMFLGELCCLIAYMLLRCTDTIEASPAFNYFIFLLPACCDMTATSLMLVGLQMSYMSHYQMLRGSVVIFTGAFSRIFLKRYLNASNWVGLVLVLLGTGVVGLDAFLQKGAPGASNPELGDLLIVIAQIVVAAQMVLEEKFVGSKNVPPLLAVGLEGLFGFTALSGFCAAAYFLPGVEGLSETPERFEDLVDALKQLGSGNFFLLFGTLLAIFSIAIYNFCGISVTKHLSAAHRMVLDSSRTVIVWGFSLIVYYNAPDSHHGQKFSVLQLVGFSILVLGSLVYYEVLRCFRRPTMVQNSARDDPLLANAIDTMRMPPSDSVQAEATK